MPGRNEKEILESSGFSDDDSACGSGGVWRITLTFKILLIEKSYDYERMAQTVYDKGVSYMPGFVFEYNTKVWIPGT